MEKLLFSCVLSFVHLFHITYSDVSGQEVSNLLITHLGENITLNCNMTKRNKVFWYHLNSEQLTLLVSAEIDYVPQKKLLINYNPNKKQLKLKTESGITVVSLVLSKVKQSDLGLYFCGTKSDTSEMHFERSIRVQLEEELSIGEGNEHSNREKNGVKITDDLTVTERVLMFGGVGLAFMIFFFATMAAAGVIHQHGWQKGWAEGKDAAALNSDLTTTD